MRILSLLRSAPRWCPMSPICEADNCKEKHSPAQPLFSALFQVRFRHRDGHGTCYSSLSLPAPRRLLGAKGRKRDGWACGPGRGRCPERPGAGRRVSYPAHHPHDFFFSLLLLVFRFWNIFPIRTHAFLFSALSPSLSFPLPNAVRMTSCGLHWTSRIGKTASCATGVRWLACRAGCSRPLRCVTLSERGSSAKGCCESESHHTATLVACFHFHPKVDEAGLLGFIVACATQDDGTVMDKVLMRFPPSPEVRVL